MTVLVRLVQFVQTYQTTGGAVLITVNYRDSRPIYEQVKDSLRKAMLTGVLSPDDKLPSVREMASQLAINPNTIQRAYRELESEGYIYSVTGKGSFVSGSLDAVEGRKAELLSSLDHTVEELTLLGVKVREICEHISQSKEGKI